MAPPAIKLTGISSIPQGYVLGRSSKGTGDVELIWAPGLMRGQPVGSGSGAGLPSIANLSLLANTSGVVGPPVGTLFSAVTGIGSALKWTTARTLTLGTDLSGNVSFDGSANFTLNGTIVNDAVTNAKLANMATSRVKGRATAGTSDPEDITLTQVLDMVGSAAHGDILFRGAASWSRLAAGTDGYVLTTHAAGVDPTWEPGAATTSLGYGTVLVGIVSSRFALYITDFEFEIPASFANTQAYCSPNPSSACTFSIRKNGVQFGTIAFSTSGVPTLTLASAESFTFGDRLELWSPASLFGITALALTFRVTPL